MSDGTAEATPQEVLEKYIMDFNVPKNEYEWWANDEINKLREQLASLRKEAAEVVTGLTTISNDFRPQYDGIHKAAEAFLAALSLVSPNKTPAAISDDGLGFRDSE